MPLPRRYAHVLLTMFITACPGGEKETDDLLRQFAATFGSVVDIPATDATPPTVTLIIPDQGSGKQVLTSSSPTLVMPLTHASGFFAIASAEDPEGVKEVGFTGESSVSCHMGDIGYNQSATLLGPTDTDAGTSGKAVTRRWIPRLVDDTYLRCADGYTLSSASMTLRAVGRNFGGGSGASASVTFTWK